MSPPDTYLAAMNRSSYSKTLLSVADINGSYFTDVLYNHVFLTAQSRYQSRRLNSDVSFTDEYKSALRTYDNGLKNDTGCYQKTITGLLEYYRVHTRHRDLSMSEFIDKILVLILPEEHFAILNDQDKFFFLNKFIANIASQFIAEVIEVPMLKMVIDERNKEGNTRAWVEKMVDIQLAERDNMFNLFVKRTVSRKSGGNKIDKTEEEMQKLKGDYAKVWGQVQKMLAEKLGMVNELTETKKKLENAKKVALTLHKKSVGLEEELVRVKREMSVQKKSERAVSGKAVSGKAVGGKEKYVYDVEKIKKESERKSVGKSVERDVERKGAEKKEQKKLNIMNRIVSKKMYNKEESESDNETNDESDNETDNQTDNDITTSVSDNETPDEDYNDNQTKTSYSSPNQSPRRKQKVVQPVADDDASDDVSDDASDNTDDDADDDAHDDAHDDTGGESDKEIVVSEPQSEVDDPFFQDLE